MCGEKVEGQGFQRAATVVGVSLKLVATKQQDTAPVRNGMHSETEGTKACKARQGPLGLWVVRWRELRVVGG